jgi:3-isopropylmalate dehydratase small subunit
MQKFETLTGVAAPLNIVNIDTDMIIPKQFLKTIKRTGLGKSLFFEMRYTQEGRELPDFVLNRPAYRKSEILVAGARHASMPLGRCSISASAVSSPPALPIFFITTVSKTAFCPSSSRLMI